MTDIVQGQIGPEAKYSLKFENGKLRAEIAYDSKIVDSGLFVEIGADELIETIKLAIPGKIDDAILDMMKIALKAA